MKATCKSCRSSLLKFELPSIARFFAIFDLVRFFLFLGPMLVILGAALNLNPMYPPDRQANRTIDYVLYKGNRTNMSDVEHEMLVNVEKICGKEYRNELPLIWNAARPTLVKSVLLFKCSIILPACTGLLFVIFHKKESIACFIATAHFATEMLTVILGVFGGYYMQDARFCFLEAFDPSCDVLTLVWSSVIIFAIQYKAGTLYALHLYVRDHFKARSTQTYLPPTPSEELKTYLKELREAGVTPKVRIDLPQDRANVSWHFIQSQIKGILHQVRIQVAQLHRDDPLVSELMASGKLGPRGARKHKTMDEDGSSAPNMLKMAHRMTTESSEYQLLTHHHHHQQQGVRESKDDVEIILPEPGSRNDPI